MSIILLSGFSRSGKDTITKYLVENYGYQRYALADALKRVCSNETGLPLDCFHLNVLKDLKDENGKTPRDYCIELGNHLSQTNPDYLCNKIYERIKTLKRVLLKRLGFFDTRIVITDIRRHYEMQYFIKNFGNMVKSIYVYRFDKPKINNELEYEIKKNDCDHFIDNSEDFEYTIEQVDKIIKFT